MTQSKNENINNLITIKEIKQIKILPTKKTPGPDSFTGRFSHTIKKETRILTLLRIILNKNLMTDGKNSARQKRRKKKPPLLLISST